MRILEVYMTDFEIIMGQQIAELRNLKEKAGLIQTDLAKPFEISFRRHFHHCPIESFKSFLRRKEYEEILYSINYSWL